MDSKIETEMNEEIEVIKHKYILKQEESECVKKMEAEEARREKEREIEESND